VALIIKDHPEWWGRTRVCAALADRGLVMSESTAGRILPVARERLARQQAAQQRVAQACNSRRVAAMIRRDERDAERQETVRRKFDEIFVPGVSAEEALTQIAGALAEKGWKVQVKDLTPELRDLADAYLRSVAPIRKVSPTTRNGCCTPTVRGPETMLGQGRSIIWPSCNRKGRLASADPALRLLLADDVLTPRDREYIQ